MGRKKKVSLGKLLHRCICDFPTLCKIQTQRSQVLQHVLGSGKLLHRCMRQVLGKLLHGCVCDLVTIGKFKFNEDKFCGMIAASCCTGRQRNVGITTQLSDVAVNLTVLLCAKVRNSSGGTAAGPRRDRKTLEFPRFQVAGGTGSAVGGTTLLVNLQARDLIPPLGNIIIYQGGSGYVLEGVRIFLRMSCPTYLALYPWPFSKWGLWTARLFQGFVFDMALASLMFPAFSYRFALC